MEEKENKKNRGKGIHSIRFSIIAIVFLATVLTSVLILVRAVPIMRSNMMDSTLNSMKVMASAYGQISEVYWDSYGEGVFTQNMLDAFVGDAKLEGIESSYVYVVDKNGIMQYHPTATKIGIPVENSLVKGITEKMRAGNHLDCAAEEYEYKGVAKLSAYYVHTGCEYVVVVTADKDEVLAPLNKSINSVIMNAAILTILCILLGIYASTRIVRPIRQITEVVSKLETLDFSRSEMQDKLDMRKDENGDMSRAITSLTNKLANVIGNLQDQSVALMNAAATLDRNTQETIQTIGQVEQAVGDIATGATSQADETQSATENVVAMGHMISATSDEVAVLNDKSQEIAASSEEANKILAELGDINRKAVEAVDVIYEQTNTTNESAQKIREATNLISSIAEETNLLSLNASIEAARAGEQGRGFAVVAAQIQKLAEQSNESANQIEQIIASLVSDTAKAVKTMDDVREIMGRQNDKVIAASATFSKVKTEMDASINGIGNIAQSTQEMQQARNNVVDVVQNLTAIAEENAASTEETSASVTEIATIIEDIAGNAASLKDIAQKLEEDMKQFKL